MSSFQMASKMKEIHALIKPFSVEDEGKSKRLLWNTLFILGALVTVQVYIDFLLLNILVAVAIGLVIVRLFAFYHDTMHKAIFRQSIFHQNLMKLYGFVTLSPPKGWTYGHGTHHKYNGALNRTISGEFPIVDKQTWIAMTPLQRRAYRLIRHPVLMIFGYVFQFLLMNCLKPMFQIPQRFLMQGLLSLTIHFSIIFILTYFLGFQKAGMLFILPMFISSAVGTYLFYVQHNTPEILFPKEKERDQLFSAVYGTSYFEMSALGHWLSGNIGFHPVHHILPTVPFYHLPEAFNAVPLFQQSPKTSWRFQDIKACFSYHIWDQEEEKMIRYQEIKEYKSCPSVS